MILPQSYPAVLYLTILSLLCLGSWASAFKFAGNWRFELFYWDYMMGILLFSLILAFTLGGTGSGGRSFLADIKQADGHNIGSAIIGGIIYAYSASVIFPCRGSTYFPRAMSVTTEA